MQCCPACRGAQAPRPRSSSGEDRPHLPHSAVQVSWQEVLGPAGTADEDGQTKPAAGHGSLHASPVLCSLAWLQLPVTPGLGVGPGEGGGAAQTLLLAADRQGNLAALDTLGRPQPLRILAAGRDPKPNPSTDLRCLPRAAWAGAAGGADPSRGRGGPWGPTAQLAVCVLGRQTARGAAHGTHSGLVLTDGSIVAVFTINPTDAVTEPPAPMTTPMPALAPGRSGAGMPSGSGSAFVAEVPAAAAAAGNGWRPSAVSFSTEVCRMLSGMLRKHASTSASALFLRCADGDVPYRPP